MRLLRYATCGALVLTAACQDALDVPNLNNPDIGRVLRTPADVENLISNSYAVMHDGIMDAINLVAQMYVMAYESHSTLANFEMGPRQAVPRGEISNLRGNAGQGEHVGDWNALHRSARIAALGLAAFQRPGFSIGTTGADRRARAFAKFALGVSLGNLALLYDSATVVTEFDDPLVPNPLSSYDSVMRAALNNLDSAIALSAGMADIPSTWLPGNTLTAAQFVRFVRSYKARFRANVARNRADRAAADWAAILADVNNGITADFVVNMNPAGPWDIQWFVQHYLFSTWHQAAQFMIGFADVSGGFDGWLATPFTNRTPFLVVTPDRRFPQGATRAAQQANSPATPAPDPVTGYMLYFRNRSGIDNPGATMGVSFYDHYRFRAFANAARIGPHPIMVRAEMNAYAAEAYLRQNPPDVAAAAALIDATRVPRGGLPPLVGAVTDTLTAVPGGSSCVPRVPDPATNFTATKCGNIWEAMKWEYRMETAFTGYGQWYLAGRGWGDLPEGTAIHWLVPYQEMDARGQAFGASIGGVGNPGGAVCPCNYGLFGGGVYPP